MRVFMLGIMVAAAAIMPASTSADDQQIADFIKARLVQEKQQGNLIGFNVDMRVDRGTVWFKGFVSNRAQELLILRTAQLAGHLGVVQVVDDIDVNSPYQQTAAAQQQPLQPQQSQMPHPLQPQQPQMQHPMQMQNKNMMPQERVAQRPAQPYMNANYQMPPSPTAGQPRPLQPQQSYGQPQLQRQPQPINAGSRMPQIQTPQAPQRMKMPLSAKEPKRDNNTQAVAYQEPVGPFKIPGTPSSVFQNSSAPNALPSFQQNFNAQTQARGISAPITAPPRPIAASPNPIASQPLPFARAANQGCFDGSCGVGGPVPSGGGYYGGGTGITTESASLPGYAWPSYAASPNYGAVSYPKQYSASAWPYIGPFYPYPQVPLGWRKVALEWDDGWWFLDFSDK